MDAACEHAIGARGATAIRDGVDCVVDLGARDAADARWLPCVVPAHHSTPYTFINAVNIESATAEYMHHIRPLFFVIHDTDFMLCVRIYYSKVPSRRNVPDGCRYCS